MNFTQTQDVTTIDGIQYEITEQEFDHKQDGLIMVRKTVHPHPAWTFVTFDGVAYLDNIKKRDSDDSLTIQLRHKEPPPAEVGDILSEGGWEYGGVTERLNAPVED